MKSKRWRVGTRRNKKIARKTPERAIGFMSDWNNPTYAEWAQNLRGELRKFSQAQRIL